MRGRFRGLLPGLVAGLLLVAAGGCATLQEIVALRQVDFSLGQVSGVTLAGVELDRIRRYEELGLVDAARIGGAIATGRLPLSLTLHVRAENPEGNARARLAALDWTLLLQDRETVSGGLPESVLIPAGVTTDVPLSVGLDLLEFFEGSSRDLVNLALALAGQDAPPTTVRLRAVPTIETPLGPIRYPEPITIARRVGG